MSMLTSLTMVSDDGHALVEASVLLHIGVLGDFLGNKHVWLVALNKFMKEIVRQKVAKVTGEVKAIITQNLEGIEDVPF